MVKEYSSMDVFHFLNCTNVTKSHKASHIETSQFACSVNHLANFYIRETMVVYGLIKAISVSFY